MILLKEFQCFYGNYLINPLEYFHKNPTDSAFIFQHYVLDVYEQRMETLETVPHPWRVIVMDHGLNVCQIFTTLNKKRYTKFGFLYLTEKYIWFKSKFFPGKLSATSRVFYLSINPPEAMKHVAFCNCSGKDQISHDYLILLDQRYNKYLNSVCSEVNYCTSVTGEMSIVNFGYQRYHVP